VSVLKLEAVSRWYGNVVAVNDVTFEVGPGITGLLGPNGAGKTTLLHMMAGFLAPSAGAVQLDGEPTWRHPSLYRRIGFVPEREAVYAFLTGRQFVLASARLQGLDDPVAAAERAIQTVDLVEAAGRNIGGYSKGMRQRIKVAAAGRTILFSSHILEEVERLSGRVLVVVAGRLAASGDFRRIRRLMTDRPHSFTIRSSDDRALARELLAAPEIEGVELTDGALTVRTVDYGALTRAIGPAAQRATASLYELRPADESLESVFSYLVRR
jgi:ABC-2 type transport system ATP-binding protein